MQHPGNRFVLPVKMPLHAPTSTQWITFPTEPNYAVTVTWRDRRERSALYYTSKCYWGSAKNKSSDIEAKKKRVVETNGAPKPVYDANVGLEIQGMAAVCYVCLVDAFSPLLPGETVIFIAAEFVESQYRDGPLAEYHIKSIAEYDGERKRSLCLPTTQMEH